MRAFLLAAGCGSRISKDIPAIPKCTLDVGGEPLIVHTIRMLQKNGIDITVITGYKHRYLEDLLRPFPVQIVYNPFYDVTNSIGSLWMAKSQLEQGKHYLIANADVYWDQNILDKLMQPHKDIVMLSDRTHADDGDYFFRTDGGRIRAYGKELTREQRDCEYVGIASVKGPMVEQFVHSMDTLVESQQHDLWWENALYALSDTFPVWALDVEGVFWAEVDTIRDYTRILDYVKMLSQEKAE